MHSDRVNYQHNQVISIRIKCWCEWVWLGQSILNGMLTWRILIRSVIRLLVSMNVVCDLETRIWQTVNDKVDLRYQEEFSVVSFFALFKMCKLWSKCKYQNAQSFHRHISRTLAGFTLCPNTHGNHFNLFQVMITLTGLGAKIRKLLWDYTSF